MQTGPNERFAGAEQVSLSLVRGFWLFVIAFFVVLGVVVYRTPFELWDESRYANNALEMVLSNQWIVLTYHGLPDHWITRPPGLMWLTSSLIRTRLPIPVAVRLPSFAAALLTTLLLYWVASRLLERRLVGIVSATIFLGSMMVFGPHVALNGDFDALLCVLLTVSAFAFWAYLEDAKGLGTVWILIAAAGLAGSILTKGTAGILLLPGFLLCVVVVRRYRKRLLEGRLWAALVIALLVCGSYYFFRNRADPGYFNAFLQAEVFGRLGAVNEGHKGGPLFYVRYLGEFFEPGLLLCLAGAMSLWPRNARDERSHSMSVFCGLTAFGLLCVLTISKSKIFYYCVPAVPLMSMFAGIGVVDAADRLARDSRGWWAGHAKAAVVFALMVCAGLTLALTARRVEHRRRAADIVRFVERERILRTLQQEHGSLVIVETGVTGAPESYSHHPFGLLLTSEAALHGFRGVRVAEQAGDIAAGEWIVSCDRDLYGKLVEGSRLTIRESDGKCVAGPVTDKGSNP